MFYARLASRPPLYALVSRAITRKLIQFRSATEYFNRGSSPSLRSVKVSIKTNYYQTLSFGCRVLISIIIIEIEIAYCFYNPLCVLRLEMNKNNRPTCKEIFYEPGQYLCST